ncbi:MAG TPA: hypothetical protein VGO50_14915 [Pyrinomonadaceae bacterium]|jgi:uncharacterized membrane protein|nr:hypothetical protein [Pyrinomonadaceae bacterium]
MEANVPFNSGAIRAGECISNGWNLIKDNYWLFLGIVLLGAVIAGCIPCISLFFIGPVAVGIYLCLFTQMRGQPVEFGMMFKGFEKFVPAMVLGLIEAIPGILVQVIRFGAEMGNYGLKRGRGFDFFAQSDDMALAGGLIIIAIIAGVGFLLFAIAWQITFKFALPILTDNGDLGIGEIIKLSARAGWSNIGGIIVLVILQTVVVLIGALALCIGIFFVIPLIWASNAIAYRMVFPESPQGSGLYNEPPRPDYYGGSFGQGA